MAQKPSFSFSFRTPVLLKELGAFALFLRKYARLRGYQRFAQFEKVKGWLVDLLYKKRGRYARPFLHFGSVGLIFVVITFGPLILDSQDDAELDAQSQAVLGTASAFSTDFYTTQAEEVRQYRGGEIIVHSVQEGETISSIASRYGLDPTTILWENDLTEKSTLKPGQELNILPVDGVRHKVAKGETIYTIAKKYDLDDSQAQVIVDYPFNEFLNEETFELAIGQQLVVPQGVVKEAAQPVRTRQPVVAFTPDAGNVSATGSFVWPAAGRITQGYSFYHRAIDVANRSGGPILAADSGVVTVAGWIDNSGYGRRVMVDHGNGLVTLYAHLSVTQVQPGQRVNRGDVLGQMGSTGRSTGTHLHFEIRQGSVLLNPLSYL
jgi:murein DD-endopeptidase MepM/ murein hydrolase activator NlpD